MQIDTTSGTVDYFAVLLLNIEAIDIWLFLLEILTIFAYNTPSGVHNVDLAAQEEAERLDNINEEDETLDEEYDSGGSGGVALTPPDSPQAETGRLTYLAANGAYIDPEKDIYAIPSRATSQKREIYFLALVDVLTQYGMKKQAAKVAKTVKYGSSVDGISTVEPEQYAARFLEFVSNAIE